MRTTAKQRSRRVLARGAAAGLATAALAVWTAGAASAHVSVSPSDTASESYSVLTFSVPHGCEGSPTTEVSIQIPEQINGVTPTRNANWNVEKVIQPLDEPITDAHGNEITERVSEVVYTAKTPLPDGYRDAFELSVQVTAEAGETLVFPTIQTCEKGETAWVQVPEEGQSEDDLEAPAPAFEVTEATGEDEHGAVGAADEAEHAESSSDDSGDSDALGWVALGVGVIGLVAGVVALVRTRRVG